MSGRGGQIQFHIKINSIKHHVCTHIIVLRNQNVGPQVKEG